MKDVQIRQLTRSDATAYRAFRTYALGRYPLGFTAYGREPRANIVDGQAVDKLLVILFLD